MAVLTCTECGVDVVARSVFEAEGECPECGAEAGSLVEQDDYDPSPRFLTCRTCGFSDDSAVADERTGSRLTVDDPCPICDEVLVPADTAAQIRDLPEVKLARAAARQIVEGAGFQYPIDVHRIAEKAGLTVVVAPFDHDGLLVGSDIEVPSTVAVAVQRFVIAHEVGHHRLRHRAGNAKIEPEANAFASELLLPAKQLKAFVAGGATIRDVARAFEVSKHAAAIAVVANGLDHQVRTR